MNAQDFAAMGLAHLAPFQPCFVVAPSSAKKRNQSHVHPALYSHLWTAASAMCDTPAERAVMKKQFIADFERAKILRVNPESNVGRSTNNDKTARIRKAGI